MSGSGQPQARASNAPVASLTTDEGVALHPWLSANLSFPNPVALSNLRAAVLSSWLMTLALFGTSESQTTYSPDGAGHEPFPNPSRTRKHGWRPGAQRGAVVERAPWVNLLEDDNFVRVKKVASDGYVPRGSLPDLRTSQVHPVLMPS